MATEELWFTEWEFGGPPWDVQGARAVRAVVAAPVRAQHQDADAHHHQRARFPRAGRSGPADVHGAAAQRRPGRGARVSRRGPLGAEGANNSRAWHEAVFGWMKKYLNKRVSSPVPSSWSDSVRTAVGLIAQTDLFPRRRTPTSVRTRMARHRSKLRVDVAVVAAPGHARVDRGSPRRCWCSPRARGIVLGNHQPSRHRWSSRHRVLRRSRTCRRDRCRRRHSSSARDVAVDANQLHAAVGRLELHLRVHVADEMPPLLVRRDRLSARGTHSR